MGSIKGDGGTALTLCGEVVEGCNGGIRQR